MFRRPGRSIAIVVGVLVIGLAATALSMFLPPRQSPDIAVPADDATPEEVVKAYLAALDAHDCDTAEAVSTDAARSVAASWCQDIARVTEMKVREHLSERPEESGLAAPQEVVHVPVTFDLEWRRFHDDGSMSEGPTAWGYLVLRESAEEPWRIIDQGVA